MVVVPVKNDPENGTYCERRRIYLDLSESLSCYIDYTVVDIEDFPEHSLIRVIFTDGQNVTQVTDQSLDWVFRVIDTTRFPHDNIIDIIQDQEDINNYSVKHSFYL